MAATFGEWLAETRTRRGLSQRQLAIKAGIAPATVSKLEDGLVGASRAMVTTLADALEVARAEAIRAWLEDDAQEGGAITYVADPEEAVIIESYRGLNSQISKSLAQRMMKQLREAEKETAIGGRRADEGDTEQVGDGDPAGDAAA